MSVFLNRSVSLTSVQTMSLFKNRCIPHFSSHALSSPAILSVICKSCIFQPLIFLVRHFLVCKFSTPLPPLFVVYSRHSFCISQLYVVFYTFKKLKFLFTRLKFKTTYIDCAFTNWLFCGQLLQIADDIMSSARSLALHSKDLVVAETKAGCLTMFTLDLDNSEVSTDTHCITQVACIKNSISRAAKHQNRSVFEASMKLCTGVDPPKGSWKKIPPTYLHPLVAAILKFNMAAILDLFSAITPKLRQVETFCLLLTPHFKDQGIP